MKDSSIEQVIDTLPVLIAYIDENERYRYVNGEYKKWLGVNVENIIGRTVCDVMGDERYQRVVEHIHMVLKGNEVSYEVEMPKNQTFFARYIPIINNLGESEGFSVLVEDITENKRLEQEKSTLVEKLQLALDEIQTLKGTISICCYCHDIRDEEGSWNRLEAYIANHSEAAFSHGVCPNCLVKARVEAGLIE